MKELVSDDLIRKAKGKFRLSVLLQKRMREYFMLRSGGAEPPLERALAEFRKGRLPKTLQLSIFVSGLAESTWGMMQSRKTPPPLANGATLKNVQNRALNRSNRWQRGDALITTFSQKSAPSPPMPMRMLFRTLQREETKPCAVMKLFSTTRLFPLHAYPCSFFSAMITPLSLLPGPN